MTQTSGRTRPQTPGQKGRDPVLVPGLVVGGLFLTLLAGDTVVSGVDLRLVGTAGAVFGVVLLIANERQVGRGRAGAMLGAFSIWTALLLASIAWSPPYSRISETATSVATLGVLVWSAAAVLQRVPDRPLRLWWWLTYLAGVAYTFAALYGGTVDSQDRLSAFGSGPNVFARVVGLGIVAAVAVAFHSRRPWLILAPTPAMLVAVLLSGSRGALLSLLFAMAAIVWMATRNSPAKQRFKVWLLIVVAGGVFARWGWPVVQEMFVRRIVDQSLGAGYSSGRDVIVSQAIDLWTQHPFLGVGLDGYWGEIGHLYQTQHPHNLILQTAVEAGTVAAIGLVIALVCGFRAATVRGAVRENLGAVAALFVTVAAMFSGSYYDSRFLWVFLLIGAEEAARARATREGGKGFERVSPRGRGLSRRRLLTPSRRP